jgi:hypothetical protein
VYLLREPPSLAKKRILTPKKEPCIGHDSPANLINTRRMEDELHHEDPEDSVSETVVDGDVLAAFFPAIKVR